MRIHLTGDDSIGLEGWGDLTASAGDGLAEPEPKPSLWTRIRDFLRSLFAGGSL